MGEIRLSVWLRCLVICSSGVLAALGCNRSKTAAVPTNSDPCFSQSGIGVWERLPEVPANVSSSSHGDGVLSVTTTSGDIYSLDLCTKKWTQTKTAAQSVERSLEVDAATGYGVPPSATVQADRFVLALYSTNARVAETGTTKWSPVAARPAFATNQLRAWSLARDELLLFSGTNNPQLSAIHLVTGTWRDFNPPGVPWASVSGQSVHWTGRRILVVGGTTSLMMSPGSKCPEPRCPKITDPNGRVRWGPCCDDIPAQYTSISSREVFVYRPF